MYCHFNMVLYYHFTQYYHFFCHGAENEDYVQCPTCQRKFAPHTAERHIPKCSSIKARPCKPSCQDGAHPLQIPRCLRCCRKR